MRIDIHGVFLMSGSTVPLEHSLRQAVQNWVTIALARVAPPLSAATVTLANVLDAGGESCKQCEIVAHATGDRRLRAIESGRTLREAVIACVGHLARNAGSAARGNSPVTPKGEPHRPSLEIMQSC